MKRVSIFFAATLTATAPALAGDGTPPFAMRNFASCLLSHAQTGRYISSDDGKFAMELFANCKPQWKILQDERIEDGSVVGIEAICTAIGTAMVQMAVVLKDMGK